MEEDGKKYLFAGSYHTGVKEGIHVFELTEDGKQIKDAAAKIKISAGDFEAIMIHQPGENYYFFASQGVCCDVENSNHSVKTARSKTLLRPYLDRNGRPMSDRGTEPQVM